MLIGVLALNLFGLALASFAGTLIAAGASTFLASVTTNLLTLRIFERLRLTQLGLSWTDASFRNFGLGLAGGVGSAALVMSLPVVLGQARLAVVGPFRPGSLLFVSVILLLAAASEELLFRGYAFQILWRKVGPFATVLPVAVLFAAAHQGNLNANSLALFNTFLWGIALGAAVLKTRDLWLASGLHFGWNWTLPLAGQKLSGFNLSVTGLEMQWSADALWSGGEYGPEGSVWTTLFVALLGVFLWKAPVRSQELALLAEPETADS
jgi:membrane protease YdiL (CAAX protease family)